MNKGTVNKNLDLFPAAVSTNLSLSNPIPFSGHSNLVSLSFKVHFHTRANTRYDINLKDMLSNRKLDITIAPFSLAIAE